ncbi:hypothetical protein M406DRAFT_292755 [Cryphonectria parasitica EP155]|uniref:Amino acid transporter transmembrane domain-containing protein n=1 Tax=Cryphonectria parasitica (strain ATCC 38755 / EP155) TaxID=660469 RepID=A0A9P4XYI0_CRYP1|nr:uncharacterized protein M406DRAFT_292755 [Cryphonectria parasitica EP155]KAF3763120.1 hypothetical protein M406DRAFT_292755 [Cryphonectria parasitica EP155]
MASHQDTLPLSQQDLLEQLNSGTPNPREDEQQRMASVIADHLPPGYTAAFDGFDGPGPAAAAADTDAEASPDQANNGSNSTRGSSLRLQGGDIHRALFKIPVKASLQRAMTFSHPERTSTPDLLRPDDEMTATEITGPQGFRRHHVLAQQRRTRPGFSGGASIPVTRNFVEFLDLYGSFAGEDLADSDIDESELLTDDEATPGSQDQDDQEPDETSPLVRRRRPLMRRKSSRAMRPGNAGTAKTFFTLLKAFIGTGIMFLPKAFNNGGILFSSLCLVSIAAISMWAFHLLLKCRTAVGGSYGDIGQAIAGDKMRTIILASITLSQLGFVCTGLVFVADNWGSFLTAVTHGSNPLGTKALIALQAALLIPLSFIRDISKLGFAATLADVFILIGLVYIWDFDITALARHGVDPSVQLFNPAAYTLTIGASIFTFEGIGLIIPIHASMRRPEHFEPLLGVVMLIITCIYTSVGAMCYATFGSRTQIEVIDNFPQTSRLVNAVQFIYALAVLIGNPVQLFPAMRILEGRIFGHRSGKKDLWTKWKKNFFRTFLVILCCGISIGGSANLDRFVALIGSVACVPLVYMYPPFLHYRAVASTTREKALDVALMVLGAVGMVYTTAITIVSSFL